MQLSFLDLIQSYSSILANGNQIAGWIIFAVAVLLFASAFVPMPRDGDDMQQPWGDC